ncbi:MAG: hypothetical protein QXM06_05380 [Archaeoglobaceae archaeon]
MLIETPRRLHLGIIDPSGTLGRRFGSLGVAIDDGYLLKLEKNDRMKIIAEEEDSRDVLQVLKILDEKLGTGFDYLVEVKRSIERHVGFGSTTQIKLAVGFGVAKINKIEIEVERLAEILGRGKNSGVSTYIFKYGGFVVDGGVKSGFPPLVIREELPKDWGFLLIIPELKRGLDEEEEKPIMKSVYGKPECAEKIAHRIILGLIPAIKERNIEDFGRYLTEIQSFVGKHFEEYQGGEFREDLKFITDFLRQKTYGFGQSSWGPTIYGLIYKSSFENLKAEAEDYLREYGIKGKVELGNPRNFGSRILNF